MAHCKNIGGGLGDEDPTPPPRLSAQQKGKAKNTTKKKRKFNDVEAERAAVVVAAIEQAKRIWQWHSHRQSVVTNSEGHHREN